MRNRIFISNLKKKYIAQIQAFKKGTPPQQHVFMNSRKKATTVKMFSSHGRATQFQAPFSALKV